MEYLCLPNNSQTSMKRRRRTSQKEKSQSSSNNPEIKRRKCEEVQSKMVMTSADWLEWDEDLLIGLGDVRKRVNTTLGTTFNEAFYTEFAARLSNETNRIILAKDVTERVKRLKEIYKSCKAADVFQHEVMNNAEYAYHMKRCFSESVVDPVPGVPRTRRNVRSRLSSRGAGSGASVSNEQMHVNAPAVFDRVLLELWSRNRERFDGHKLTLFTRLLKRDPQLINVFLMCQNDEQMLDFIDDQQLERFDF